MKIYWNIVWILEFVGSILCRIQFEEINTNRYGSHIFKNNEIKQTLLKLPSNPEEKLSNPQFDENSLFEIIEGDILIDKKRNRNRNKRKIINEYDASISSHTRWPAAIVPYDIDSTMSKEMIGRIQQAIQHWQNLTCIRFQIYDSLKHSNYKSKLHMLPSNMCGSFVGYREDEPMYISNVYLGMDCTVGSIIHELGHTIGFRHEHSRTDRDKHVVINMNMVSDRTQYDIMQNPQPNYYSVPYDLYSIMHYSSQNGVIQAVDPKRNFLMGQRIGLSFLDAKLANLAYQCSKNCPNVNMCQNEGYVDQYCKCVCPYGFSGNYCEMLINTEPNDDNVIFKDENNNITLDCDFSNKNLCKWTADPYRATNDWTFSKDSLLGVTETQNFFSKLDPNFKTGPQPSDTVKFKNYIYLNSLRKTTNDANAILSSPQINVKVPFVSCLRFWYQMYAGKDNNPSYPLKIGNLSLNILMSNGDKKVLWQVSDNQGKSWKNTQVQITIPPPAGMIYFEAQLNGISYGDIALTELSFLNEKCKSSKVGNFTNSWSSWTNCSVTCGIGTQYRTRICNTDDINCNRIEIQNCSMPPCPENNNYWSEWTEYSECSVSCGTGYYYRVRVCKSRNVSLCIGDSVQYEKCEGSCKIQRRSKAKTLDIITSDSNQWSQWSVCTGVCGNQTKSRSRFCNKRNCQNGLEVQNEKCISESCKYNINKDDSFVCGGQYNLNLGEYKKINSPNYPSQYPSNTICNYYIKSPPNTKINVKLLDVDLEESKKDTCIDGLEFRYFSLGQPGPIFCGKLDPIGAPYTVTSFSNFILIIFRSNWGQSVRRRGFLMQVDAN